MESFERYFLLFDYLNDLFVHRYCLTNNSDFLDRSSSKRAIAKATVFKSKRLIVTIFLQNFTLGIQKTYKISYLDKQLINEVKSQNLNLIEINNNNVRHLQPINKKPIAFGIKKSITYRD
jgi:hypothetical protein